MTDSIYRIAAGEAPGPLVIDVSRSGTTYPAHFLPTAPFHKVHAKISPDVARIVLPAASEGATVLMAAFPPTFIDPNRPLDDIDPVILEGEWPTPLHPLKVSVQSGSGLIHTLDVSYEPLFTGKLAVAEVQQRIEGFYTPYHEKLAQLLAARRSAHGIAYQLSCHSMSSVGPRDGVKRPEICIGDMDGATSSPEYLEIVAGAFRAEGFEIAMNKPFRGNELLRRHAEPHAGICSLQVEMRRDLYIDEKTRDVHEGIARLQRCFTRIAAAVRPAG